MSEVSRWFQVIKKEFTIYGLPINEVYEENLPIMCHYLF